MFGPFWVLQGGRQSLRHLSSLLPPGAVTVWLCPRNCFTSCFRNLCCSQIFRTRACCKASFSWPYLSRLPCFAHLLAFCCPSPLPQSSQGGSVELFQRGEGKCRQEGLCTGQVRGWARKDQFCPQATYGLGQEFLDVAISGTNKK